MRSFAVSFALAAALLAQSSQASIKVVTSTRVECSPISTNLLSDASFETGELGAWTPWYGISTVVSDNSDAGKYALTITSPSSPYRSIRQTVTGLTVGTSYTLSFDYRIKEVLLVQSPATCLMYLEYDNNRVLSSGSYSYVPGVTPEWTNISGTLMASATEHSFVMWGYCGTTTLHSPVLEFDNARFERPLVDGEPTESCSTLTDSSTVTYTSTPTPTPSPNPTHTPTPSPLAPTSVLTTTTPYSTPLIISPSSATTSPSVTPSSTPSKSPVTRSSSIPVIPPQSSNPANTFTQIPVSVPTPVRSRSLSPLRSPSSVPAVPVSSSRPIPGATTATDSTKATTAISTSVGSTSSSVGGSLSTTTSLPTLNPPTEDGASTIATLSTITAGHGSSSDTSSFPSLTTSTVFSTRTATITACPASVTDCPASSTYVTTETVYVSTTICPVTDAAPTTSVPHGDGSGSNNGRGNDNGGSNLGDSLSPSMSTSTVLTTRIVTITACPQTVTDCPARSTFVSTETLVASTTVVTVIPNAPATATALPTGSYGSVPYPGGSNARPVSSASPAGAEPALTSSSGSASESGSSSGSASIPGSPSGTKLLTAPKQDSKVPAGPGAIRPSPPVSGSAYYPTHSFSAIPSSIPSSPVLPEPSTLVSVSAIESTTMTMSTTTPAAAEFTGSASVIKQDILLTIGAAFAPLFFLFF